MKENNIKTLNLRQMLDDIRLLVENDFCADMELTAWDAENGKSQFTKNESITMARIIAKVYSIAHCTTCEACQKKYLK